MTATIQKHQRGVIDWLREVGAEGVHIAHPSRGHPRIVFSWRGEERSYVVPSSPGDAVRGQANAIADLRRMLGLVAYEKRVGERREKKAKRPRSVPVRSLGGLAAVPLRSEEHTSELQ